MLVRVRLPPQSLDYLFGHWYVIHVRLTAFTQLAVEAYRRGYRVRDDGTVISPYGRTVGWKATSGYYAITLKVGKKATWTHVHLLAAYQRFGDKALSAGVQVRHLNGNTLDNSKGNIAIGSQSDNQMDIPADVRRRRAAESDRRKLTFEQAQQLRKDHKKGTPYSVLVRRYGVSKATVSYIVTKRTYQRR